MNLTAKRIAKLRQRPGRYHDGHGLILQVSNADNASWVLRYQRDGRERWLGLGPLHTVGLKEARERARAARLRLLDGIDPVDQKRADKAARVIAAAKTMTFAEAAKAWHAQHEAGWRNAKHVRQALKTLADHAFPKIGSLPVAAIDTGLVLKVIEPIWREKTSTASRVRGRIELVLDWATVRGYRSGENPARWKGHLAEVLPAHGKIAKPVHHAALPFTEIGDFLIDLRGHGGIAARALEFLILTTGRTGEVIGAQWGEFDLANKIWTVPAGRMKAEREHRVPLSNRAVDILKVLPRERGNDSVFIGLRAGTALSSMAMTATLKRMDRGDITVHGFRSTFRDWAAERTNFPNHVVEMALAHAVGDKVEAAYRRGDLFAKRQKLMEAWAAFCATPSMQKSGNVSNLREVG